MLKNLLIFVFSINFIFAQNEQYLVEKLSTDNGLPSNVVKSCVTDNNGFLWIATQAGIVRFDGIEVKVYNQNNTPSIQNNRFGSIERDSDSTLIAYNSIYQRFRINKKSELELIDNLTFLKGYIRDANYKVVPLKIFPLITNKIVEDINTGRYSLYTTNNNLFYLVNSEKIVLNGKSSIAIDKLKDKPYFYFTLSNQLFFISVSKGIYKINVDKIEYISNLTKDIKFKFNLNINDVFIKPTNDYVSFFVKDSFYLMHYRKGKINFERFNLSFKGVYRLACYIPENKINTIFFHSFNKGLFMVKKNIFKNKKLKYVGQNNLRVTYIKNNVFEKPFTEKLNKKLKLNQSVIFNLNKDTVCYFNYENMVYYVDGKYSYKKVKVDSNIIKDEVFEVLNYKNIFIVLTRTQILYLTKNMELTLYMKFPYQIEYACKSEKTKNWLISLQSGDLKYYDRKQKSIKSILFFKNKSVRFIKYDSKLNCFWIFTYGMGVFLLDENLKVTSLDIDKKSYLNYGHYFLQDSINFYWIPTNNGLFRFKQTDLIMKIKNSNHKINYNYFSIEHGLMNNEFNGRFFNSGVVLPNGNFALSNVEGIVTFNPNSIKEDLLNSPILIDDVIFNDRSLGSVNQLSIKEGFVDLKLVLAQANIGNYYSGGIEYKILGGFSNWLKLESNILELTSLKKGDYNICFKKIGENNANNYVYFKLTVLPLWYNSNWAYAAYVFLLGLLIYFIILFFFRNKQKKQKNELMLMESELKALRAQINPHYISNSLMSLQSLILKNDKFQAMEAMSMYGKVMRGILNDSEKPFVSLQTEISTLKDYINLEAMLFYEKADFTIKYEGIDPVLLHLIEVPSMLIQPYVENAINHGLMPKKTGPFQLSIHFEFNEKLICVIQDNGIGRSLQSNDLKRASKGNLNIENRIKLYGKIFKQSLFIDVIDLKNENNEPCGTKVIIQLPYYLN